MANLCKHYKRSNAEKGIGFNPPAIPFIPKATTLKTDDAQEFNLCVSLMSKKSTYKLKAYTFSNGTAEDVLERGKRLAIIMKISHSKLPKASLILWRKYLKALH
eukprot:15330648-Ditylum_brightwellii.AAC.1